jgi:hypothetical protein
MQESIVTNRRVANFYDRFAGGRNAADRHNLQRLSACERIIGAALGYCAGAADAVNIIICILRRVVEIDGQTKVRVYCGSALGIHHRRIYASVMVVLLVTVTFTTPFKVRASLL